MIGIVGHRDLVAEEIPQIRAAVATLLERLRDQNPDVPFRLLCSMASGADLLAADVAAQVGIDIIVMLPYARQLCRNDLATEAERANFDRLCDLSDVVELVLPEGVRVEDVQGPGEFRDRQYQRGGSIIARYSGLMIAIWNGENTAHRAGTARAVEFRHRGVTPEGDIEGVPRDTLFSSHGDDLNFEIRCSRISRPTPGGVDVIGFTCDGGRVGSDYPQQLRTTLTRIAEFNRDVQAFGEAIVSQGRRLSQPSPTPVPDTLQYLDQLFIAADWMGSHYRRCFTAALQARYLLWALMAFLLIAFKKDSAGPLAMAAIVGVLAVFLSGTVAGGLGASAGLASEVSGLPRSGGGVARGFFLGGCRRAQ